MRPYLAQFSLQFRLMLHYRAAALAGAATQAFFGWIRICVLGAFYAAGTATAPLPFAAAVDYVWLTQAMLMIIPMRLDGELQEGIRSGAIANELLRPVDAYWMWFARGVARRLAPMLMRAAPLIAVAFAFGGLHAPASAAAAVACALSMVAALFLSAALTLLLSLGTFWTVGGDGLAMLAPMIVWTLSGITLPLPLFPDWIQPLFTVLPFRGLLDTPVRLYSGDLPAADCWQPIAHQLVWTMAMIVAARITLIRGLRRLSTAGG